MRVLYRLRTFLCLLAFVLCTCAQARSDEELSPRELRALVESVLDVVLADTNRVVETDILTPEAPETTNTLVFPLPNVPLPAMTNVFIIPFTNALLPGITNIVIIPFPDGVLPATTNTGFRPFPNGTFPGITNTVIIPFPNGLLPGVTNTGAFPFPNGWLPGVTNSTIRPFPNGLIPGVTNTGFFPFPNGFFPGLTNTVVIPFPGGFIPGLTNAIIFPFPGGWLPAVTNTGFIPFPNVPVPEMTNRFDMPRTNALGKAHLEPITPYPRFLYGPRLTIGVDTIDSREDFDFAEISAGFGMPWPKLLSFMAYGDLTLVGGVGYMRDENDDEAVLLIVGPAVTFDVWDDRVTLEIGSRPTLISESELGTSPLGGPIQFISHAALRVHLGQHIELGGRVQHMSSAGFDDPNPGADVVSIDFIYRP